MARSSSNAPGPNGRARVLHLQDPVRLFVQTAEKLDHVPVTLLGDPPSFARIDPIPDQAELYEEFPIGRVVLRIGPCLMNIDILIVKARPDLPGEKESPADA